MPRAQVQALALLMQCRSAAPLVVGLGWGVASAARFLSGSMRTLDELHEAWLDPTTPSKVSTRAKSPIVAHYVLRTSARTS